MEFSNIETFLNYYGKVKKRTLRLFEYIPVDKIEWTYQEGKFTIGDLIRHMANIERYMYAENVQFKPSRYQGCGVDYADGYENVVNFYREMHAESLQIFSKLKPEDLQKKCTTPAGIEITMWKWLRLMAEHEIHHRGQLYIYLGMLNVKTPPIYGLTSEEVVAASSSAFGPVVSAAWLNENLHDSDLIILDASPKSNVSGLQSEFENRRIPGARYFDLKNKFSDKESDLPNMLPSPAAFAAASRELGINKSSKIVVYDNLGIYTSPRVWWMFRTMGHDKIAVLNGGLPDWANHNFATEEIGHINIEPGDFIAQLLPEQVRDYNFVSSNITAQECLVIDARSTGRFNGTAPEPRAGLPSGHIPNSVSLPYGEVLENGKFKTKKELKKIFDDLSVADKPLVFSCGSGLTACIILLASELVLENEKSLYDGSWTEWGGSKK